MSVDAAVSLAGVAPNVAPTKQLAFVALVTGTLGIAFAPILAKLAVNVDGLTADGAMLSPVAVAFWRMVLATPVFATFAWRRPQLAPPWRRGWLLLVPGLFFALDLGIWHWSFEFTSVANSTLEVNFAVVIVAVVCWRWFGDRFNWRFPVGAALALAGMVLLVGFNFAGSSRAWIGDAMGLGVAFAYSGYQLSSKIALSRFSVNLVMAFATGLAALFLLCGAWLSPGRLCPVTPAGWLCVVSLALLSQVIGQGLIAFGMRRLPVGLVSVVLVLQPVFAAGLGWLMLGQALSATQLFAGALVVAGIYLARRGVIAA